MTDKPRPQLFLQNDQEHEEPETNEIGVYHRSGSHYNRLTITYAMVAFVVGALVTAVWNVSKYDFDRTAMQTQITTLTASVAAANTKLQTVEAAQASQADQIGYLSQQLAAMRATQATEDATLQKISDSNARLEERVSFMAVQMAGRMPIDNGTKPVSK